MRAVVQRVSRATVVARAEVVGRIDRGFLVLLGVHREDDAAVAARLAEKVAGLRLFEDEQGKMNLGLRDVAGDVLCISQFTLYGTVRRGRRPSFDEAAPGDVWHDRCMRRSAPQSRHGGFTASAASSASTWRWTSSTMVRSRSSSILGNWRRADASDAGCSPA